jgi:hypothetical protein
MAALSDKLATQSSVPLPLMTLRKPKLDWIKEVLADLEDDGEHLTSFDIVWGSGTASVDSQPIENPLDQDQSESLAGDDHLFCPSWQLMRLTAARKS